MGIKIMRVLNQRSGEDIKKKEKNCLIYSGSMPKVQINTEIIITNFLKALERDNRQHP